MRYKTVHSVLEWVATVHRSLRDAYEKAGGQTDNQRLVMLLDYLADHERMLAEAIERYDDKAAQTVLDTWCDYNPEFPLPTDSAQLSKTLQELSVDGVIEHYLACHRQLADLYKQLAREADTPHIGEVFSNLAQLETREIERSVRDSERLRDL